MNGRGLVMAALGVAALVLPSLSSEASFTDSTTVSVAHSPALPPPPGISSRSLSVANGNASTFTGMTMGKSQGKFSGVAPQQPSIALMTVGGLLFGLAARRRMARNTAE